MRNSLLLAAVLSSTLCPLAAQAAWTQLAPSSSPSARAGTIGVSDGLGMVTFGGLLLSAPNTWNSELWRFDGANWTNLTPAAGSPPPRDFYGAAWDSGRARYVLFGGRGTSTTANLGDTWEWDGTTWTQITPATSPSPRQWAAMTYDLTLGKSVLFGGNINLGGTSYVGDTWTWDGTNWTQLSPTTSPSIRGRGFFSYDPTRLHAIYYGGRNSAGALSDTWKWDGANWTLVPTVTRPGSLGVGGLFAYGCTYDLARDRHVIYGGTRNGATLSTIWEFDGVDWLQRATGPLTGRTGLSFCYVPTTGKNYCFGGFSTTFMADTWQYQTNAMATYTHFGSGCAGSSGVPTISSPTGAWIGTPFRTDCDNLSPLSLPILLLGFSNTAWSVGPLPFPLGAIYPQAGPGCDLLVSPDTSVVLGVVGTTASYSLALPNDSTLLGIVLHEQLAQLDGITLSLSVSGGATATLGAR